MKLVSTPWMMMRGKSVAQLALSTLVLASACGDDKDPIDSADSTAGPTGDPTGDTDPTTGEDTDPSTDTDATGSATEPDPTTSATDGSDPTADTGVVAVDYMTDIQPIWDMRCLVGCHIEGGNGALTTGLILSADLSHASLVDAMSVGGSSLVRVAPGDYENSYLWHKIMNTQVDVGGSGYQMPIGGLPEEEVAKIEAWIEAGAKP